MRVAAGCRGMETQPPFITSFPPSQDQTIKGKRDLMYHNGPLFLLIFSGGKCDSLKDVLSSSVDPLRPLLIYVLTVSAVAVTTEGLR